MVAGELYDRLDSDFRVAYMKDDWSLMEFNKFISPELKKRHIGVMLDNADEIKKVYTAVFPDRTVIDTVLKKGEKDILIFTHHAMGYDGSNSSMPFYNIPESYLDEMKEKSISLYVLHIPLDKNGEHSTSVTLANALGLRIIGDFCEYEGFKVGTVCKTDFKNVYEFTDYAQRVLGHEVKLRGYGDSFIKKGMVAIAAGGGSYPFVVKEVAQLGLNTYLTGFTRPLPSFEPTMEFHRLAQKEGINVIGATHYSTEKFACISMVEYFKKIGIAAEFIEGSYYLQDL